MEKIQGSNPWEALDALDEERFENELSLPY